METTQQDIFPSEVKMDDTTISHLKTIVSWAMLIVAVTVMGYVLNIVELFTGSREVVTSGSEGFSGPQISTSRGGDIPGTIISIMIGLFINYFLYRFATITGRSVKTTSPDLLGDGFRQLRIYFLISSIFMILFVLVMLILVAVVL